MRNKKSFNWKIFTYIILVIFLITNLHYIVPLAFLIAGGYGIYTYRKSQKRLSASQIQQRISALKETIRQTDGQLKQLDGYKNPEQDAQYQQLSLEVLPRLRQIDAETQALASYLDNNIYRRIMNRIRISQDDIKEQLKQVESRAQATKTSKPSHSSPKTLEELASEIVQTVQNIQTDHEAILEKIAQSDSGNKEELTAVHQSQMERFEDVLQGYLKIKASPKDFHNAEERLEKAKAAMEQFDIDLDDTLKELNEADMRDFDISLRIITNESMKKSNSKGEQI